MSVNDNNPILSLWKGAQGVFKKKFLYDVFKTFIGVFLAFWVSEWRSSQQSDFTEHTALREIRKELDLNILDLRDNLGGHRKGLEASRYFWKALHNQPVGEDTLTLVYNNLLRNFVSIQHAAAYESIKSRGLEIIRDDSLRTQIANLFDLHLEVVEKLEEQYSPHDFFQFYYHHFNEKFLPHIAISDRGKWTFTKPLSQMPETDKTQVKMWLMRLMSDRQFMISAYSDVEAEMLHLRDAIDVHLKK